MDDETLMAYVDGELDAEDAARVHDAVARDPELRQRAEVFETSAQRLRDAFQHELDVPVPQSLQAVLEAAPPRPGLWQRLAGLIAAEPASVALAACVLLAVGAGAGVLAMRVTAPAGKLGEGLIARFENTPQWHAGFNRTTSGETFTVGLAGGTSEEITPLATFLDAADRYCRSYLQSSADAVRRHGVVCRQDDGRWHAVVQFAEADVEPIRSGGDGYLPASNVGASAIERVVETYATTALFSLERERALIEARWTQTP